MTKKPTGKFGEGGGGGKSKHATPGEHDPRTEESTFTTAPKEHDLPETKEVNPKAGLEYHQSGHRTVREVHTPTHLAAKQREKYASAASPSGGLHTAVDPKSFGGLVRAGMAEKH